MKPVRPPAAWGEVLVGCGILGLTAVLGCQAVLVPTGAAYVEVGPEVAPRIVTALLAVLGTAIVVQALRGGGASAAPSPPVDRRALRWVVAGLALDLALIRGAGFVIASTVLFACTARAFGSTRVMRDAACGFALALTAQVAFDRLLGYRIGSGLIEQFL